MGTVYIKLRRDGEIMRKKMIWGLASCVCVGLSSTAHAGLEVALHEVNTSVGLLPTTTANKWKLQTDPVSQDVNLDDYVPIAGELNNTYDPTQYSLATDPQTGAYALGYSVEGVTPYEVTSFDVLYKNGGYYQVALTPGDPEADTVTPIDEPSGGEKGEVDDITFDLISSDKNQALPITQDQLFFQLNLVALNDNPDIIPEDYTAFPGPGLGGDPPSFVEGGDPAGDTETTTFGVQGDIITASEIPEPAPIFSLGVAGLLALARRGRRKPAH
jgi:hypothetical protein